jgi:glycosyltransferase involved in cell wall biosynthesis
LSQVEPAHPEVGVIALPGHDWSPFWQVRQQVLTRLASRYHVVWVNPGRGWRESWSVLQAAWHRASDRESLPASFAVYTPGVLLPRMYRPRWLASALASARIRRARRILERKGCRKFVLYLWRPEQAHALSRVDYDVSCYHIDDEYSFSTIEAPLDEAEVRIIGAVDQVFISSPKMFERKGPLNPNSVLCRNGVNFDAFSREVPEPSDLAAVPRPRIGYIGFLKKQLDWPMLHELAERRPEWNFVFVGGRSPHASIDGLIRLMEAMPNVFFLGVKNVVELPAYPQHFDVCLLPYRVDDYTKYIDPLKLYECLASGRPVVSSPIPAVEEVRHLLELAANCDEWSAAISKQLALAGRDGDGRRKRQEEARRHDWQASVEIVAARIAASLGIAAGGPGAAPSSVAGDAPHDFPHTRPTRSTGRIQG